MSVKYKPTPILIGFRSQLRCLVAKKGAASQSHHFEIEIRERAAGRRYSDA
jgi:hypothetical protein